MTIKQYNGQQATFYIQCKGEHSGRPLKTPIPNCFAIFTDIPNAFELAYAAFISKSYHRYLKGSCQQFIRISDAKEVLYNCLSKVTEQKRNNLKKIQQIDDQILNVKKQLEILNQSKVYLAKTIIS